MITGNLEQNWPVVTHQDIRARAMIISCAIRCNGQSLSLERSSITSPHSITTRPGLVGPAASPKFAAVRPRSAVGSAIVVSAGAEAV